MPKRNREEGDVRDETNGDSTRQRAETVIDSAVSPLDASIASSSAPFAATFAKPTKSAKIASGSGSKSQTKVNLKQKRRHQRVTAVPTLPLRQAISTAVMAKVTQVCRHSESGQGGLYISSNGNAIVSEAALAGSLVAMAADWDMDATLASAEEAIVSRFEQRIGTYRIKVPHVVLNIQHPTSFERRVQEKVQGWGLEESGLLRVELEMYYRGCEEAASAGALRTLDQHGQVVRVWLDESRDMAEVGA